MTQYICDLCGKPISSSSVSRYKVLQPGIVDWIALDVHDECVKKLFQFQPTEEEIAKVETNMYDKEEIYPNCTVQILTNTVTGEVSVGWWKNDSKLQ